MIYNPNKNKPKERNNKNTSKINRASFTINKSYRNIHKSSNLIKTIKDKDLHKKIKNVPIYSNKIKTCNKCNEKLEANQLFKVTSDLTFNSNNAQKIYYNLKIMEKF